MRKLLRTVRTLILLAILLAAIGWSVWRAWQALAPQITTIPVVTAGGELIIQGSGFGAQQGQGRVVLLKNQDESLPMQVISWSRREIRARLPEEMSSGTIEVHQQRLLVERRSNARSFSVQAAGLPSQPLGYQAPVQADSPWPTFRRDIRNSGSSPITSQYNGEQPWSFQTGKGIFSTPVIDNQGSIYVGSADHYLYAIARDGRLKWKYQTGEIIDSAGALGRYDPEKGYAPLTFISGDGFMYQLRTDDGPQAEERVVWKFEAELRPEVSYNRWFEGNVAVGPDGTLYAGNTNFNYYAINPDGSSKWTYSTGSNNWSQAAFGADGTIYWGSVDTYVRAVDPGGQELWNKMTLGFIAASAAVGSDGTVYIGSFDSNLYALDGQSGKEKWKFPTRDHIYSSAALGSDATGKTTAIYFGSADGKLYAVNPQGKLLWAYDTGDPIRSSPALGKSPEGGEIVYFGCGNGKLYALNASDGSLRWAFDTTPQDAELHDRNDLNGSPALSESGVVIGGEHGAVWSVPYDYCLNTSSDARCSTGAGELPEDFLGLYYVTPGGNSLPEMPEELPSATLITLRLLRRAGGETVEARVCTNPLGCPKDALVVTAAPTFPFTVEPSADGRFIYVRPEGFLQPGQSYTLKVSGRTYSGGLRLGNLTLGGWAGERFSDEFSFRTNAGTQTELPLSIDKTAVSAMELTRFAVPMPPMMPSLNQIGFDYMDWIIGTIKIDAPDASGQGRLLAWAIGARRLADGTLVAEPESDFTLPLSGHYQGGDFILSDQDFTMPVTGIPIPFNRFELRGRLGADLSVEPGAVMYADTEALSIPTFGPYLVVAGLANNVYQKLLVTGTYITRPYQGPANLRPAGIAVKAVGVEAPTQESPGRAQASFELAAGASYPANEHRAGLLLVDRASGEPVYLDYNASLQQTADAQGNLNRVLLDLPAGLYLPRQLDVYVLLDVFPLHQQSVQLAEP